MLREYGEVFYRRVVDGAIFIPKDGRKKIITVKRIPAQSP